MEHTVVTTEGHVVIPRDILDKYRIQPGTKMAFVDTAYGLVIKPVAKDFIRSLLGKYQHSAPSSEEMLAWKSEEHEIEDAKYRRIFGE